MRFADNRMNEHERAELESLKQRQNELLRGTTALVEQLRGKDFLLDGVQRDLRQLLSRQASLEEERRRLATEVSSFEAAVMTREAAPRPRETLPVPPEIPPQQEAKALPPPIPEMPPVIVEPMTSQPTVSPLTPSLSTLSRQGERPPFAHTESGAQGTARPT